MAFELTIDDGGYWGLAGEDDPVYYLRVEYSKSSRAKCRACNEFIKSKTVRIGKPVKWRGIITSWTHPQCFWISADDKYLPQEEPVEKNKVHGLGKLTKSEQKNVLEAVKRTKPPKELEMDEEEEMGDGEFGSKIAKELPRIKQPDTLTVTLMPFQEEGFGWMLAQEQGTIKGGILADEMGMGKTIQTISLLLEQKRRSHPKKTGPTLVVCPASAMLQWQEEIKRCSDPDALNVFVFHGNLRQYITPKELISVDVVLTTYPTLEHAYRTSANQQKVGCKYCKKKFLVAKLILHNKYFCGPNSKRSVRLSKTDRNNDEKQQRATEKAMVTLKIKKKGSLPTPANIYRELMASANRVPVSMYENKRSAARISRNIEVEEIEETNQSKELERQDDNFLWSALTTQTEEQGVFFNRLFINKSKRKRLGIEVDDIVFFSNIVVAASSKPDDFIFCAFKGELVDDSMFLLKSFKYEDMSSPKTQVSVRLYADRAEINQHGAAWWPLVQGSWIATGNIEDVGSDFRLGQVAIIQEGGLKRPAVVSGVKHSGKSKRYEVIGADDFQDEVSMSKCSKQTQIAVHQALCLESVSLAVSHEYSENDPRFFLISEKFKQSIKSSVKSVRLKKQKEKVKVEKRAKKDVAFSSDTDDDDSEFVLSEKEEDDSSVIDDEVEVSSENTSVPESVIIGEGTEADKVKVLKPRFVPATWGVKSEKFEEMMASGKAKNRIQSRKRKKRGKKPSKRSSKKKKSLNSKSGATQNDDEFLEEYSVASSSSEEDSSDSEEETALKKKEPFRFANEELVVDEDGVDLGFSLLHSIAWNRIILDEAHKIKDRTNSTAKATFALRGYDEAERKGEKLNDDKFCKRWCLTGTPLQNRVGELYALIRFLRVDPFAYYYCSMADCNCRALNWKFGYTNRKCLSCGHPPLRHFSYFNKHIMNPIKRVGFAGKGRTAMRVLREELLMNTMLRRTKVERKSDLKLPKLEISVVKLNLTEAEQDFYDSVYMNTRSKFDTFVKKGTLLHNYAHIFELLSRLRRSADHPYLVIHGNNATLQQIQDTTPVKEEIEEVQDVKLGEIVSKSAGSSDVCGICNEDITDLKNTALAYCRHTFHRSCVTEKLIQNMKDKVVSECPLCYQPLSVNFGFKNGATEEDDQKLPQPFEEDDKLCVICFERPRNALIIPCGHLFTCMDCVKGLRNKLCPMCREPIKKLIRSQNTETPQKENRVESISPVKKSFKPRNVNLLGRKSILQKIALNNFESSSKIDAVVSEVQAMRALPVSEGEMPHKAIIFSQYSDMIDLVEWKLRISGIHPVKLVGSMSVKERQAVLKAFRESPDVTVIIMSLKAGGEGLNLQVASHVFILETWWNPQVHNQAYQRAHRIGQKRDVRAVLFVTDNTIEERMHELQTKKELVFQSAVEGCSKAMKQLTEEDLRFLFSR